MIAKILTSFTESRSESKIIRNNVLMLLPCTKISKIVLRFPSIKIFKSKIDIFQGCLFNFLCLQIWTLRTSNGT